jgi:hypothetical protein
VTLGEAERRGIDLSRFHAGHIAAAHPFALARMTKIVAPRTSEDTESELLVGEPVPFILWPHQREILAAAMRRRRVIVLKARQLGVTWVMALYALWYVFSHQNAEVVIVSIGEREARKVGRRIQWLYDNLPEPVRAAFPAPSPTLERFTVRHEGGDSLITSLPSSSTAGRGETTNVLLLDEGAHWEDGASRLASLLPSAEDIGQTIFASTANGLGEPFQETWEGAPENDYFKVFANATSRPDRDAAWVRRARTRVPDGKGVQEYPMTPAEAFLSSGKCAFSTRHLQDYIDHRCRPAAVRGDINVQRDPETQRPTRVAFERDDVNGQWRVWDWRREGRRYLITADACGGGGGTDYASAQVWDMDSWDEVACFHGRPEPVDFATILIRAGWLWRNAPGMPALLAPESNLDGRAVMAILRERDYANVWQQATYDQNRDDRTVQMGWATTSRTRPIMLASLKECIRDGTLGIRDNLLIGECLTFETNPKTGKEEAREGKNDDRVMAAAIAAVVLGREASGTRPRETGPAVLGSYRVAGDELTGY